MLIDLGDHARAQVCLDESLELWKQVGSGWGEACTLHHRGVLAVARKNPADAGRTLRRALTLRRSCGDRIGLLASLDAMAIVLAEQADPERATRLLAAVDALRREYAVPRPPVRQPGYQKLTAELCERVGAQAHAEHRSRGEKLDLAAAVELALGA
jgi:hypothetical protein